MVEEDSGPGLAAAARPVAVHKLALGPLDRLRSPQMPQVAEGLREVAGQALVLRRVLLRQQPQVVRAALEALQRPSALPQTESSRSAASPEAHCTRPVTTSMPPSSRWRSARPTTVSATTGASGAASRPTVTTMSPSAVEVVAVERTV